MSQRWRIRTTLRLVSPLHVGCGTITRRQQLTSDEDGTPCDVQAIALTWDAAPTPGGPATWRTRPCIPGTAIKGVLRAWAEAQFPSQAETIQQIFGKPVAGDDGGAGGLAEFLTAEQVLAPPSTEYVPYWDADRGTGVLSHVAIDRDTGAAEAKKLFYVEYVPAGAEFQVEVCAANLAESDIQFLLALFEQGTSHRTHPLQFGANAACGRGRVEEVGGTRRVTCLDRTSISLASLAGGMGFDCCHNAKSPVAASLSPAQWPCVSAELRLSFQGPFLVNDASRVKRRNEDDDTMAEPRLAGDETPPDFTPLRRENGDIWLPSASFRGAIRQRAEFLLRSLQGEPGENQADSSQQGPIERIFGRTSRRSRLRIEEFTQAGACAIRRQDFVAIDRFTGGAADKARFDAQYADAPTLKTRLTLDLQGLRQHDVGLLALVLRDVCQGNITFGFGGAKGYGQCVAELSNVTCDGLDPNWIVPESTARGEYDGETEFWLDECVNLLVESTGFTPFDADAAEGTAAAPEPEVVHTGTLNKKTKSGKVIFSLRYQNEKGAEKNLPSPQVQQALAPSLAARINELADGDHEVQYDLDSGAKRLRLPGDPVGTDLAGPPHEIPNDHFVHPYYFLPMKDRAAFDGELGDSPPVGHSRWIADRYSGTVRVRLTLNTPLLLCDRGEQREEDPEGHRTYGVLTDDGTPNGKPLLASSSVRGMLRAAFEAITNSRFGVFPGSPATQRGPAQSHGRRQGMRLPATSGLETVPARIVLHEGRLAAQLLTGGLPLQSNGRTAESDPLPAAWCGYGYNGGWKPSGLGGFQHRDEVWAYLTPWRYRKELPKGKVIEFRFWNVEALQPAGPTKPSTNPAAMRRLFGHAEPVTEGGQGDWHQGFLCVTQRNMTGKHDERIFFGVDGAIVAPFASDLGNQWRELIADYHDQHRRELEGGKTRPPALPASCVFSRHISESPPDLNVAELELREGELCYAKVERRGDDGFVATALYPVMIARKLHSLSPLDCLPESLRPAKRLDELSPADRVFGWVSQEKLDRRAATGASGSDGPAYRAQLRVGPVECTRDDAIESFEAPRTLPILGQPKPAQGRFYLGNSDGKPQSGLDKEKSGYQAGNRIRGPKVYPHHQQFREPPRGAHTKSRQNRSVTGWVKAETTFEFDLQVTNLSGFELGALLWLLSLPDGHFLRMGMGKPLGFGSVEARIVEDGTRLARGSLWAKQYATWASEPLESCDREPLIEQFKSTMDRRHAHLRRAFLVVARGFAGRIHYPQMAGQDSEEYYEWFVKNDKEQGARGSRCQTCWTDRHRYRTGRLDGISGGNALCPEWFGGGDVHALGLRGPSASPSAGYVGVLKLRGSRFRR